MDSLPVWIGLVQKVNLIWYHTSDGDVSYPL